MKMKKLLLLLIFFIPASLLTAQTPDTVDVDKLLLESKYKQVIQILSQKDSLTAKENYKLGIAYMNLMQYPQAAKQISRALRQDAFNTGYLYVLGNIYDLWGKPVISKYYFDRVLDVDSNNFQAKIKLGKVLMDLKDYRKAEKVYGDLVLSDSLNDYFVRRFAFCKIKNGDTTAAVNLLKNLFNTNYFTDKSSLLLAKIYYTEKKYDSALVVVNKALGHNTQNAELNKLAGDLYFKMKKYRTAIVKLQQTVMFGDSSADVHQKLGLSYYSLSKANKMMPGESPEDFLNKAYESLRISYDLDSENPITTMYLGLILKEKEDYKTAVRFFEKTLDLIYPTYLDVLYINLGASYELTGDLANAIKAYQQAREFAPGNTNILFYLAIAYDKYYKDKSVALKYYKKFLAKQKNADPKLTEYAKTRIERLKEIMHFTSH